MFGDQLGFCKRERSRRNVLSTFKAVDVKTEGNKNKKKCVYFGGGEEYWVSVLLFPQNLVNALSGTVSSEEVRRSGSKGEGANLVNTASEDQR